MRIEQLRFFTEIAISNSITTASENLFVSQSALSRSIKSLEEELGVTLLSRSVEGVHLTQCGEALLPYMYEVLEKVDVLKKASESFSKSTDSNELKGIITVATIPVIADMLVFPALEQMKKRFPSIQVKVQTILFEDFGDLLSLHSADVCVSVNINNIMDDAVECCSEQIETLFSDPYLVVVKKSHPLAKKHIVTLDDVLKYKIVAHNNGQDLESFYKFFTELNEPLDIVLRSNNWRIIKQALLNWNAVLITNNLFLQSELGENDELTILPIRNSKGVYFALFEQNNPQKELIQAFIDTLQYTRILLGIGEKS